MLYHELVRVYQDLDSTTKRLEKTAILADFLGKVGDEEPELLSVVTLLCMGRIFPTWSEEELGIGAKLLMKAISMAVGVSPEDVENQMRETGDVGLAAEELYQKKSQVTLFSRPITIEKVYQNLMKMATISGNRAQFKKIDFLMELLSSASPTEAKYLTRTVLEELRVGVGEGTIRDAISQAFKIPQEVTERAHMLTNDMGLVAEVARMQGEEGLRKLTLKPGKPVKPMLAQLSPGIKTSVEEMGWAICETKYDGIRVQIHRHGEKIDVFTRRLENVSEALPEIADYVEKSLPHEDFIVEGEIIASRDGKPISFQYMLQRVRRKYDVEQMISKVPLTLYLFDVLYYKRPVLDEPLKKRRKILESIVKPYPGKLELSRQVKVTPEEIEMATDLFEASITGGHEGIMIKDPHAPYMPGIRGKKMLKLKAEPETLDLVVVGGTYGKGKRAHLIGSYLMALQDENGQLLTLAYAATGLDDQTLLELSEMVEPLIISKKGREVKIEPSVVLEIAFSEIVESPESETGYSLRFPVVKRIRSDRGLDEIDTLERIQSIFKNSQKS
ncbi:ATP-dependent DNA ligase [Methanobacterium petrolearium]|uniref:ATP-dependent DNA ligase n=1 Tax=Methanobacterium petrolearium TaxID=710190 RepID=UPI001AE17CB5|nr:ATP-dependent DNA ligase [Methanobacterium petrolearium]MBP1945014.1 DNA ligase-1 [Methanobacterium petrolearium]BDZ70340.1 DNA ligase [Methanobacterium petrolearium]